MESRRGSRLPRHRFRHPVPPPATKAQIRQKIERIRALYRIEAILELSRFDPNTKRLAQFSYEVSALDEVLASLEEQP